MSEGLSENERRKEYIRLLEQALESLGFRDAAAELQKESGVSLEPSAVGQLRAAISCGAFDTAVLLIEQLPLSSSDDIHRAKFLVLQQKFLEVGISASSSRTLKAAGLTWVQLGCRCSACEICHTAMALQTQAALVSRQRYEPAPVTAASGTVREYCECNRQCAGAAAACLRA